MKSKYYTFFSVCLYILSFLILSFCIVVRLTPNIYLTTRFKLLLLFLVFIFIYISGYILIKKLNYKRRIVYINLIIYFLIYTVTIFSLTLFDEIFGRRGLVIIDWNKSLFDYYFNTIVNLVPFKTVKLYILGFLKGNINFKYFSINVFGNLFAFMPYGIFLPLMCKSMNKFYKFLLVITFSVLIIEVLQFVTLSGSCDIDDLILNVVGACVAYLIFRIKNVNSIIRKVLLYE